MTFTRELLATLNTLMADHNSQEILNIPMGERVQVWLYDSDSQLVATASIDGGGGIRVFEWQGAIR